MERVCFGFHHALLQNLNVGGLQLLSKRLTTSYALHYRTLCGSGAKPVVYTVDLQVVIMNHFDCPNFVQMNRHFCIANSDILIHTHGNVYK